MLYYAYELMVYMADRSEQLFGLYSFIKKDCCLNTSYGHRVYMCQFLRVGLAIVQENLSSPIHALYAFLTVTHFGIKVMTVLQLCTWHNSQACIHG